MPTLLLHFWPYIAMAIMSVGLWGFWEEHKADKLAHQNDQATIQQNLKDRNESAKQIGILQGKLEVIDAKTQPIIQRITSAPVTTGCGPSVTLYSVDGVRDLFSAGAQPSGPQPVKPTGVPASISPAGNTK